MEEQTYKQLIQLNKDIRVMLAQTIYQQQIQKQKEEIINLQKQLKQLQKDQNIRYLVTNSQNIIQQSQYYDKIVSKLKRDISMQRAKTTSNIRWMLNSFRNNVNIVEIKRQEQYVQDICEQINEQLVSLLKQ